MYQIDHYLTADKLKNPYMVWLQGLRNASTKMAILRRIMRLEKGNFGDHRFCRDGVWELRIDVGPGFRVYYALTGHRLVLLLAGGNKRTQDADIACAVEYWRDWQRRTDDEK